MKLTVVFITLLSITWAMKVPTADDMKGKREAPIGYPSNAHSSQGYQTPSFSQEDANAISIGAGYSVGGGKPSFSYGAPEQEASLQFSSESLPSSGHATIQLSPITLQQTHGNIVSSDLSQLMSQLTHGLSTGAISLAPYQNEGHAIQGGQEYSAPQFTLSDGKLQQYISEQSGPSVPSYAAGTKGLGSYSSTGPVLFSPSDSHSSQPALTYGSPSAGHSFGDASALSFGSGHSLAGLSFGDSGHSLGGAGHSLGSSGLSLGDLGHSLGGAGYSLGGSGQSLGHAHSFGGPIKSLGGSYAVPSKASFKPSTFLGHSDQGHSLSGLSGSYGTPSFGSHSLSGGHGGITLGSSHGPSLSGSSKFVAPSYLPPKSKGYSSHDSIGAFSSGSHASPPRTTYGVPTSSFSAGPSSAIHASSSHGPQYYVSSKYPSFGEGSSFKGPSSHGAISSFSSGPKYGFGGHSSPSSRYAPKDVQGSYSETSYNTIKYSEEMKPRVH